MFDDDVVGSLEGFAEIVTNPITRVTSVTVRIGAYELSTSDRLWGFKEVDTLVSALVSDMMHFVIGGYQCCGAGRIEYTTIGEAA